MQRISTVRTVVRTTVLGLLAMAIAMPIWAQDNDPSDFGIDEIVVTATKREQSLQDVPIAISAFSFDDLSKRGVEDLQDLAQVSPSLQLGGSNSNSNGGVIRIRGMGTSGNNVGLESAVGVFIDGVYRSRAGQAFQDLVDIERVEVLRGPQGTLFGKNTSAGALSVITKRPSFDWGGHISLGAGSRDARKATASITGPIVDDVLAFRLSGSWHERDGPYQALTGGARYNGRDRYTIKGQLLYTPTEDFDLRIIADYTEQTESCCPATQSFVSNFDDPTTPRGSTAAALAQAGSVNAPVRREDGRVGVNWEPEENIEDWGISAEVNYDMDWASLTGIFSYREFDSERIQDIDFMDVDILQPQFYEEPWETWTVELRLAGRYEDILSGFDWMFGVFSSNEEVSTKSQTTFGEDAGEFIDGLAFPIGAPAVFADGGLAAAAVAAGTGTRDLFTQETRTYAFFTHNTLYLTETVDLTIGVRYTWEEKKASQSPNGAPFQPDPSNPDPSLINNHAGCLPAPFLTLRSAFSSTCDNFGWEDKFDNTDWSFFSSIGWSVSDDHRVYFSFSHGFKSGGWNSDGGSLQAIVPTNQADPNINIQLTGPTLGANLGNVGAILADGREFEPEFTNNFELGVKSVYMDGRLTLNTAIFHTTFKNYQLNTFTGLFFFINNVPRVKARGIEVEGVFALTENIISTFGVTYADTRYGDNLFIGTEEFPLEGKRINGAPLWSGAVGVVGTYPIMDTGWDLVLSTNLLYRGRRNTGADLDPRKFEKAFIRINAQIGIQSEDGRWEVTLWGENLNDAIVSGNFNSVFQDADGGTGPGQTSTIGRDNLSAFVGEGRLYGLTLTYRFGDE